MKIEKWFSEKLKSLEDDLEFRLESLILRITEKICIRMEAKKLNRTKLASLLDVSPPAVTKILNGSSNFTLKTLLSLADALDMELNVDFVEKQVTADEQVDVSMISGDGIYIETHGGATFSVNFPGVYYSYATVQSVETTEDADASATAAYTEPISDLDYYRQAA